MSHPAGTGVNDTTITVSYDNSYHDGGYFKVRTVSRMRNEPEKTL